MGFPSENIEGIYRNKLSDVVRFLETRHPNRYKIYNLCSERAYDPSKFQGRVSTYPFDDHNAPPIEMLRPFCLDVEQWLSKHEKNVAVIHCKAGKGRTGVMICSYLLHSKQFLTPEEALEFYGAARTKNGKGVTIPSQIRYVHYYNKLLVSQIPYQPRTLLLTGLRLISVPKFRDNSCSPFFIVKIKNTKVFKSKAITSVKKDQETVELHTSGPIPLCGDVKIELYHKDFFSNVKMFTLFHSRLKLVIFGLTLSSLITI
jgi:phosphatidylinositol-3,4,5-trisphosphate 3-phosphatase/dual-specificity protein phosphatase PTEN